MNTTGLDITRYPSELHGGQLFNGPRGCHFRTATDSIYSIKCLPSLYNMGLFSFARRVEGGWTDYSIGSAAISIVIFYTAVWICHLSVVHSCAGSPPALLFYPHIRTRSESLTYSSCFAIALGLRPPRVRWSKQTAVECNEYKQSDLRHGCSWRL